MRTFVKVALYKGETHGSWWEVVGDKLRNYAGGYHMRSANEKHLSEPVEAEEWEDLNWSDTNLLDSTKASGWLARDGRWYGCEPRAHDTIAWLILKSEVRDLEATGWVRVMSSTEWMVCPNRLSAEQRNWLSLRGHKVDDDD